MAGWKPFRDVRKFKDLLIFVARLRIKETPYKELERLESLLAVNNQQFIRVNILSEKNSRYRQPKQNRFNQSGTLPAIAKHNPFEKLE